MRKITPSSMIKFMYDGLRHDKFWTLLLALWLFIAVLDVSKTYYNSAFKDILIAALIWLVTCADMVIDSAKEALMAADELIQLQEQIIDRTKK